MARKVDEPSIPSGDPTTAPVALLALLSLLLSTLVDHLSREAGKDAMGYKDRQGPGIVGPVFTHSERAFVVLCI